ncbi:response regulator receiver protein [Burkholderia sp. lig30]|jgi:CheY-like chemotaxis protein|nr:response regulator receiver protein [Burkholderia sp. lig30]
MRILLVEDDPMIGEAVQAELKDASYAADRVTDGAFALTAFAAKRYDLILLDLGLPGRDGLAVLAGIRARDSAVPVIVVTARDGGQDADVFVCLVDTPDTLVRARVPGHCCPAVRDFVMLTVDGSVMAHGSSTRS